MKSISIFETAEGAAIEAAHHIGRSLSVKPNMVLGLATGGPMISMYQELRQKFSDAFANTVTFNLDEYLGLHPLHPNSYHSYMRELLFDHVNIDLRNTHLPDGSEGDGHAEAQRFETAIANSGGIDIQLLGLGANGHIGFNEPGASFTSRTRVVTLSDETRHTNARFFSAEPVPRSAITMGIETIIEAKEIILLATGAPKADAVAKMICGPIQEDCPASSLQLHQNARLYLDKEAASKLDLSNSRFWSCGEY